MATQVGDLTIKVNVDTLNIEKALWKRAVAAVTGFEPISDKHLAMLASGTLQVGMDWNMVIAAARELQARREADRQRLGMASRICPSMQAWTPEPAEPNPAPKFKPGDRVMWKGATSWYTGTVAADQAGCLRDEVGVDCDANFSRCPVAVSAARLEHLNPSAIRDACEAVAVEMKPVLDQVDAQIPDGHPFKGLWNSPRPAADPTGNPFDRDAKKTPRDDLV